MASLRQAGHYNDFSPQFRKELEDRVRGFGKSVRYKFDVGTKNPDETNHDGKIVYPNMYTLDPVRFNVNDPHEKREGKSKSKLVILIEDVDEKGVPNRFKKVKADGRRSCIVYLDLENSDEDFQTAMLLELHPKNESGMFPIKELKSIVSRIDNMKEAIAATSVRAEKLKALNAIKDMDEKGLVVFADAMQWDSTQDETILRNMAEELAEENPVFFNDLVSGKLLEYQAVVKQAIDRKFIAFDPATGKFTYAGTQQPLAIVSVTAEKNEVVSLAEYLMASGTKETEVYNKLKSLLSANKKAATAV